MSIDFRSDTVWQWVVFAERSREDMCDEFRTSCLHHKTEGRCTNLILPDATNHLRKIHAILTYQTETNCLACINRDNNGCRNIRKLFRYYLETGGRPERYVRGVEI